MDWKLVGGFGLVGLGLFGFHRQSKRAESFEATQWWNRQSATGHEMPSGDYGGFFIQTNYDKETIKEIFKDWKPKAYPYEKRITQDSFNNWCENCGEIHDEEKLIHYQFYLPQSNSRRNRMRYVSGNYCSNDASCGADICEDCYGDESCEECGEILCNTCKEDSEYATGNTLCQECMPEEYQAETVTTLPKNYIPTQEELDELYQAWENGDLHFCDESLTFDEENGFYLCDECGREGDDMVFIDTYVDNMQEAANESFNASGSGEIERDGGRMVSIEETTIVNYSWQTDPDEVDVDEWDIQMQVEEKVQDEYYADDYGSGSFTYTITDEGVNVRVDYEWDKTTEDGDEEYIKGW
jgi:hypothetical protein